LLADSVGDVAGRLCGVACRYAEEDGRRDVGEGSASVSDAPGGVSGRCLRQERSRISYGGHSEWTSTEKHLVYLRYSLIQYSDK